MNEKFEEQNLIELPEQKTGYPDYPFVWFISKEFRQMIERMPYYSGILLEGNGEERKMVRLGFAQDLGFLPEVPLKAYFKGDLHAKLLEKSRPLYIPEGLEEIAKVAFHKSLDGILGDLRGCILQDYFGTSKELEGYLKRDDEER
jgi:hypothetical protein